MHTLHLFPLCRMLEQAASEDPAAFICHFYNFYFAHTAGGRMIGKKVRSEPVPNLLRHVDVALVLADHVKALWTNRHIAFDPRG